MRLTFCQLLPAISFFVRPLLPAICFTSAAVKFFNKKDYTILHDSCEQRKYQITSNSVVRSTLCINVLLMCHIAWHLTTQEAKSSTKYFKTLVVGVTMDACQLAHYAVSVIWLWSLLWNFLSFIRCKFSKKCSTTVYNVQIAFILQKPRTLDSLAIHPMAHKFLQRS